MLDKSGGGGGGGSGGGGSSSSRNVVLAVTTSVKSHDAKQNQNVAMFSKVVKSRERPSEG